MAEENLAAHRANGQKTQGPVTPKKMLKMKIDPTMCMKTKANMTNCPAKNRAFYRKMQQLLANRRQSRGLFGRKHTELVDDLG